MSKASIIIPAFNQARFLGQAIESALGQTHRDLEVVVVDDGSPDDTRAVAARFTADPRFKYVRQENTGLAGARNRGIRESSGEYLSFLDSDDFFHADKIARQVALLEADIEAGFAYCDIVTVDENGQPLAEQYSVSALARPLTGNIFQSLLLGGYFPPHTVLIRRRALDDVGDFDPELGGHADYDLWLRVSGAGYSAGYCKERLAYYRSHAGSMSRDDRHMAETRLKTFRKLVPRHPDGVADALHSLQQINQDLFNESRRLRNHWHSALAQEGPFCAGATKGGHAFSFLENLQSAKLTRGRPDQMAIWDATIADEFSRAIYLQPPAELTFHLPEGGPGRLVTAVAIHPDAWNKPGAGGCEFRVRVDDRLVFVVALDPACLAGDRIWHELALPVPGCAGGNHCIVFETRAVGQSDDFRWALWRAPQFNWTTLPAETLAAGVAA